RTRERLAAAIDGVDEWARADATPAEEEITRIRRLIGRIQGDLAERPATERAQVDQAVTLIRNHPALNPPMPPLQPAAMPPTPHASAPRPCAPAARPTPPVAASGSSPRSARPPPKAQRSASPPSPAPQPSTAASSTGTATCSARSTPSKPAHPPPAKVPGRPS